MKKIKSFIIFSLLLTLFCTAPAVTQAAENTETNEQDITFTLKKESTTNSTSDKDKDKDTNTTYGGKNFIGGGGKGILPQTGEQTYPWITILGSVFIVGAFAILFYKKGGIKSAYSKK